MSIPELEQLLDEARENLKFFQKDNLTNFEENVGYYKGVISTLEMIIFIQKLK